MRVRIDVPTVVAASIVAGVLGLVAAWGSEVRAQRDGATASTAARPDDSRFTVVPVIPAGELDEPMAFDVAGDGRVFVAERKGALKLFEPSTGVTRTLATLAVNHRYVRDGVAGREAEEGLIGIGLDPTFDTTGWLYTLTADPQEPEHVLSRWTFDGTELDPVSRRDVLRYPVQRRQCCHVGGGIAFDASANLYLATGANSPDDVSAATPDDLRGKILRIHPEPDGSYTIPAGNMFPPGTPGTRPEVFAMGVRNPWRITIDPATGFVYWGEIGDNWDEFNQARRPGFFGWPYYDGQNEPRPAAGTPVPAVADLSPQPAFIRYDSTVGADSLLGAGTRCSVGGPIYHRSGLPGSSARPWPDYFEGKWLITDCVRSWIIAADMTSDGELLSLERLLPDFKPSTPLDMKFGPDGDLYVLEYGVNFFMRNENARLVRVEYAGGNRPPVVRASADAIGGGVPFRVSLSSAGTQDPDGQVVTYRWTVTPASGGSPQTFDEANPVATLTAPGVYTAVLTATDPDGSTATAEVELVAGNGPPSVDISLAGNTGFYVEGAPIDYAVTVRDAEDGPVSPDRVAFGIHYIPEGFDVGAVRIGRADPVDATTRFSVASALMREASCTACHQPTIRTVGPSMRELAERYRPTEPVLEQLARKVRAGGTGVWGTDVAMPPHPGLTLDAARSIVRAMLAVDDRQLSDLPLSGTFTPAVPAQETGSGAFLLHAAYTDRGAPGLPPLTSDAVVVLRSPLLLARNADRRVGVTGRIAFGGFETAVAATHGAYVAFTSLDLSGVRGASLWLGLGEGAIGGTVEVRRDSPDGPVLARYAMQPATSRAAGAGRAGAGAAGGARRGGVYGGIEGGVYDNVGSAANAVAGPPTVTLALPSEQGERDVYLVFANADAPPGTTLMTFTALKLTFAD